MTGKQIAELAWKGTEMPEGLKLPEQWLYQTMKLLSWHFRKGLTQEEAAKQKAEAMRAFELAMYHHDYGEKTFGLWNRISVAAGEYALNPSLETADVFFRTVYGLPEDWRKDQDLARKIREERNELR